MKVQRLLFRRLGAALILLAADSGCAKNTAEQSELAINVTSTAFTHNGKIPALYTGEGKNVSPPLAWTGVPAAAKSLVLIGTYERGGK